MFDFYDVAALTVKEFNYLMAGANPNGEIIVVHPSGGKGDISLQRYYDFDKFLESPGKKVSKFSIAGVGSSEVGAAAFARTLADFTGEPVGAIVAGYGLPDLVSESLGGWFNFGAAARMMDTNHRTTVPDSERKALLEQALTSKSNARAPSKTAPSKSVPLLPVHDRLILASDDERIEGNRQYKFRQMERHDRDPERARTTVPPVLADTSLADNSSGFSPDTLILVRLLQDSDRQIDTILGHSRGCLSIASALEALSLLNESSDIGRARRARIITTGAVVGFPAGYTNVKQYLGTLDWFGGMNSVPGNDYVSIPNAWHHVNTSFPFHMNMQEVLKQAL